MGFRRADAAALREAGFAAVAFSAIEIEQNHMVAEVGVAGDGAGAAAFGVAGVTACDHDSEGGSCGLCGEVYCNLMSYSLEPLVRTVLRPDVVGSW